MRDDQVITWLLEGDVSLQYQVHRDLLDHPRPDLQERIAREGWGQIILSRRKAGGHWGDDFYQPKWISTHYTLLDLRNLNLSPAHGEVGESIGQVLDGCRAGDGGIRLGPSTSHHSDVCVNGMFLNYASYFQTEAERLYPVVDSILNERMPDGGFNCRTTRSGAVHSSLHTSISVLEGLYEFQKRATGYRAAELDGVLERAREFILLHRFYLSDRTGEIIHKDFLKMPYPCRWRYDFLRGLDFFRYSRSSRDGRMERALALLKDKRNKEGLWNLNAAYPGQVHIKMEEAGKPGRWNTLRALRVLRYYELINH